MSATDALLNADAGAVCLLEVCLELLRLGYPVSLLRSVTHSLPKSPTALLVRRVFRVFLKLDRMGHGGDSRGNGDGRKSGGDDARKSNKGGSGGGSSGFGQSGPRGSGSYESRGRDEHRRSSGSRKVSSSSSSSSSSERKRLKKLSKARKVLSSQDPDFKAWSQAQ